MKAFYLALSPWVAFVVADRSAGPGLLASAVIAASAAAVVTAIDWRFRKSLWFPLAGLTFFTGCACFSVADGYSQVAGPYDRSVTTAVLALIVVLSAAYSPLTLSYCRDDVTPSCMAAPGFRRNHVVLTLRWGLTSALIAVSFAVGATDRTSLSTTLLNWVLPLTLIAVLAWRSTGVGPEGSQPAVSVLGALDGLWTGSGTTKDGLRLESTPSHSPKANRPVLRTVDARYAEDVNG